MNSGRRMTAFYLETVLMVILFVLVIMILTQVFGLAREESAQARQLTNAVCLAQNAAEAISAAGSEKELRQLLDEDGNTAEGQTVDSAVSAYYDANMEPMPAQTAAAYESEGILRVDISWQEAPSEGAGGFVTSQIRVYEGDGQTPLYTLDTGSYLGKEGAR